MNLYYLFAGFILGYFVGRYIFFKRTKDGKITRVVPQRTIKAQNFKQGDIYKAMANRLKREGEIMIATEEPEKMRKLVAAKLNVDQFAILIIPAEQKGIHKFIYKT